MAPYFDEVIHVDQTRLPPSPGDSEIWQFAKANHYHILTKDYDFDFFASVGWHPPKIIILQNAQVSVRQQAEVLISEITNIRAFLLNEEVALMEIPF